MLASVAVVGAVCADPGLKARSYMGPASPTGLVAGVFPGVEGILP